jgi:DNA polymerase III alpha subunit (gram-positive type)
MASSLPTLFLSFDVETDGTNPSTNNLLSIGICGITKTKQIIFAFSENVYPLPTHIQNEQTMQFWNKPENANAWKALLENRKDYKTVFKTLSDSLRELAKTYKLVFVAHPSAFDWMFLKCYYEMAQHELNDAFFDIGYTCVCISTMWKTYVAIHKLNKTDATELEKQLSVLSGDNEGMEHVAIYDARNQGMFYVNLLELCEK